MKEYSNDVRYEAPELRVVRACRGGLMAASLTGVLENEIYSDGVNGSWDCLNSPANETYEVGLGGSWAGVYGSPEGPEGYSVGTSEGSWAGVYGEPEGPERYTNASGGEWSPEPEGEN